MKNYIKLFRHMQTTTETPPQPKSWKELMSEYEIKIINQYVAQYGTLRKAAAVLGVSHSLLSYKMKKYYEQAASTPSDLTK